MKHTFNIQAGLGIIAAFAYGEYTKECTDLILAGDLTAEGAYQNDPLNQFIRSYPKLVRQGYNQLCLFTDVDEAREEYNYVNGCTLSEMTYIPNGDGTYEEGGLVRTQPLTKLERRALHVIKQAVQSEQTHWYGLHKQKDAFVKVELYDFTNHMIALRVLHGFVTEYDTEYVKFPRVRLAEMPKRDTPTGNERYDFALGVALADCVNYNPRSYYDHL